MYARWLARVVIFAHRRHQAMDNRSRSRSQQSDVVVPAWRTCGNGKAYQLDVSRSVGGLLYGRAMGSARRQQELQR
jgi:hypothetical protein